MISEKEAQGYSLSLVLAISIFGPIDEELTMRGFSYKISDHLLVPIIGVIGFHMCKKVVSLPIEVERIVNIHTTSFLR